MKKIPPQFFMLFFMLFFLPVSTGAIEGEPQDLSSFIEAQNVYRQHRAQPNAPVPDKQDIAKALDGEIIVKKGNFNATGLRYVWAAKIMDVDAVSLWLTLIDREHYDLLSDNIIESFISEQFDTHFYTYNILEAPLVSTRHQVLDATVNPVLYKESRGLMWEHYWNRATDVETKIAAALSQNKLKVTDKEDLKNAVIVQHNDGSWLMFQLPDGRTWAETYTVNDPGGKIPDWVVRKVSSMATGKTIKAYEKWATKDVPTHINDQHINMLSPDGKWISPAALQAGYPETITQ